MNYMARRQIKRDLLYYLQCIHSEIKSLKEKREEYLKMVEKWSTSYVHNGEADPGRGAFSSLSVKVTIISGKTL